MYRVVAFDAFGTIFDVYSIAQLAEEIYPGNGQAISVMWRDRQIEYTRLVSMADPSQEGSSYYTSFWDLTIKALQYTCARLNLVMTEEIQGRFMNQYAQLDIFPDVIPVLKELQHQGIHTSILSNGSQEMLKTVVDYQQLSPYFEKLISVDDARHFKVMPQTYQLILDQFSCQKKDVLFISCNAWDIVGAAWFGLPTYWVNRFKLPFETIGLPPTYQASSLIDLPAYL
jgi:2-haloacid dehalogenase